MRLNSLTLTNFKNIAGATLEFSPKINCLLGNNGMGKSNLLDALYLLSYCKSFAGLTDSQLIRRGEEYAIVSGQYTRRGVAEDLQAVLRPGRRKSFKRAGKEYRRLADHIGAFPLVLVSPADIFLATGDPSERRRFIDQIASQSDARYLDALVRYTEAMEQRNKLLRVESADTALFEALEMQMDAAGVYIARRREQTIDALQPIFGQSHADMAPGDIATINYRGVFAGHNPAAGDLADRLAANRRRDLAIGHTSSGPHRDDVDFELNGAPVRRIASQGQTKTFTSALRMAQYELLRRNLGINPLLLLDDIFDKLDSARVERIIGAVASGENFGQIFITDTNRRHLDDIVRLLDNSHASSRLWNVENGVFTNIDTL